MKTKFALLALAFAAVRLSAETVASDTVVFSQADPKSPIIARLKAGTTIHPVGEAPSGWKRVEVAGPFEAYVKVNDITKGLDVREGAGIYSAPRNDAPVIATGTVGDKTELVGLANNDWAQIKLDKSLQGFIAIGATANKAAPATSPATSAQTPTKPTPSPAPSVTTPSGSTPALGRPAPMSANSGEHPRILSGKFVVAKRLLNPNPPYDYQLQDRSGRRLAYIDTKRLLLTENIEAFIDRNVSITGTMRNTTDGKDLVIAAESMKVN